MENIVVERFIKYIKFNTTSDPSGGKTPSSVGQIEFAKILADDLRSIGLQEVELDSFGYVYATLPACGVDNVPVVGFVAHMDTSPDFSGTMVSPRIIDSYKGGDILLNVEKNITLSPSVFKSLNNYVGQPLIVTDGTTLLGADDKAGVSEIVTAMEYLVKNRTIRHGKVRIAFTPDEEIGEGADHFDVPKFGADFAYTIDGGEIGELEFENFNAAGATIVINGSSVHPGYAKDTMKNAVLIANGLINLLPPEEVPEKTEGYEGFFHITQMSGSVEKANIEMIIRDFTREGMEQRKSILRKAVSQINEQYGQETVELAITDQYFNMREKIEPVQFIVDIAAEAMRELKVPLKIVPIRGGTDGARLSYMGLPCPNIFGGGHNFHGKYEYIPIPSMIKACAVIIKIVEKVGLLKK